MFLKTADIPGQHRLKKAVASAFENGRFPQSLLLTGPDIGLLQAVSLWLAEMLMCIGEKEKPCGTCSQCAKFTQLSHPDLQLLVPAPASAGPEDYRELMTHLAKDPFIPYSVPETADLLIGGIRDLIRKTSRSAFEGHRQVMILIHADRLRKEAANAFLKVLEEPPTGVFFILATTDPKQMLPTILSRCQQLPLDRITRQNISEFLNFRNISSTKTEAISVASEGHLSNALVMVSENGDDADSIILPVMDAILQGRLPIILEHFQVWEKSGKDAILSYMTAAHRFFQDAMKVKLQKFSGVNRPELVEKYLMVYQRAGNLDLAQCLDITDEASYRISRNIHVSLVLLNFTIRLRKLSRNK